MSDFNHKIFNSKVVLNLTLGIVVLMISSCGGGGTPPVPSDNQPQAVDDTAVALFEVPLSINVLANDTSVDGIASISVVTTPANGSAVVDDNSTAGNANDDVLVYTPDTAFVGDDSFSYRFTDSDGDSDTAVVTITVSEPSSICKNDIGLSVPTASCSPGEPCVDLLLTYAFLNPPVFSINTISDEPFCGTSERGLRFDRPAYDDGTAKLWPGAAGVNRYWCETRPEGTSTSSPRPLIIWVPGSGGHAGSVYDSTSLRDKQETFNISGDPNRPGFILVSIQPRNLHWPTLAPQEGTKSETYYRDLGSPSTNPDFRFVDHIVDSLVAEGVVEPTRIYLMGWSNGARFSALYSIARHEQATTAGNHVAAVANFSGGNPFASYDLSLPQCTFTPLPNSALPFYMISRTCDVVACDAQTDSGVIPGNVADSWITALKDEIGADTTWVRIDEFGIERTACATAAFCGVQTAFLGHLRWPDGVEDSSDRDHEPEMLQFLTDHPYLE